jgi:hypothetical protein
VKSGFPSAVRGIEGRLGVADALVLVWPRIIDAITKMAPNIDTASRQHFFILKSPNVLPITFCGTI